MVTTVVEATIGRWLRKILEIGLPFAINHSHSLSTITITTANSDSGWTGLGGRSILLAFRVLVLVLVATEGYPDICETSMCGMDGRRTRSFQEM